MAKTLQAIRGMNDCLPAGSAYWQYLEAELRALMSGYGYSEIRTPIVEKTELFQRSIGEVTDIVEKEMYTFPDRNNENLTLRPEGTAGCVRAAIQHSLIYGQPQRLWYIGPMFRYEKPQKGRYRQFHQIGVETFGFIGPDIDAELILMTARLWRRLGIEKSAELHLNSLGSPVERENYLSDLVSYFGSHKESLDEDSRRRLKTNPMRILDSKNPKMQELIQQAPQLIEYLQQDSKQHFKELCHLLERAGLKYKINPRLVRGLDYYNLTVFEWVTDALGAQGAICGGGRYDGLVEQLGGKSTPACGFAMGLERIIALLELKKNKQEIAAFGSDIYLVMMGDEAKVEGLALAEAIRDKHPKLKLISHCGGGNFKKQMKKADQSQAKLALILAEDEVANKQISIKYLREEKHQESIEQSELSSFLTSYFAGL